MEITIFSSRDGFEVGRTMRPLIILQDNIVYKYNIILLIVCLLRHTFYVMITYLHIRASISKKVWYYFLHTSGIFVVQHMMFYIQYPCRKFHAHNLSIIINICARANQVKLKSLEIKR